MDVVNVHEAKTHLSKLLERVKDGETFVLAKNGTPYARLVPLESGKRPLGLLRELLGTQMSERLGDAALEPASEQELTDWE